MTNSKSVRWGIIGCGAVTEIKSGPAYQNTDGFEVVAVMRRDQEKAADYAKRHNISKHYSNADDLIADNEIDDASEEIAGHFDALLEIYRAFKHGNG